jgi:uncharacterized protein YciI
MRNLFVVFREAGSGWNVGKSVMEQPAVGQHAAFMESLADEGVVIFGGPLDSGDRFRALLIVRATSEAEVRRRLADDPWTVAGRLRTLSIEPWTLVVGAERLPEPVLRA